MFNRKYIDSIRVDFPASYVSLPESTLSEKLTYTPENYYFEPKNEGGWKMIFLFNWVIFRFHANFRGCIDGRNPASAS